MDTNKKHGEAGVTAARQRKTAHKRRGLFRKSEDGAAAIEFAIVAPVFLMMTFGIFEVGLNYVADRMLSVGLDTAARKVRTGQVKASEDYGANEFKEEICDHPIMFLFDCDKLLVDVQEVASFDENSWETDENGQVISEDFGFAPGGRSTINVVRAFYEWPTVINWTNFGQSTGYQIDAFDDDARVISVSTAFMTEPFGSGAGG